MKYIKLKEKSKEELFDIADQLRYDILIKDKEIERLNNEIGMKDFDIEAIKREVKNRDMYINKLEKAYCKELERLNNIINEANKILSGILVVNDWEHKGRYRPVKNTTSQEVYKSVCMLYGILKTPYRSDYGSLEKIKGSDKE